MIKYIRNDEYSVEGRPKPSHHRFDPSYLILDTYSMVVYEQSSQLGLPLRPMERNRCCSSDMLTSVA